MTDLIKRLQWARLEAEERTMTDMVNLFRDAADRIEKLEAENAALKRDAGRLDWLEQHPWYDAQECLDFVDEWRTPDGKRHSAGLRAAIDASIAEK